MLVDRTRPGGAGGVAWYERQNGSRRGHTLRQFSPPHLAALTVLFAGIGGSVCAARRRRGRWTAWFAAGLALLILAAWAGEYVTDVVRGTWSIRFTLPLQLTDVVSLCAVGALLTRRPLLVELTYYWAFTATLQAVMTPD